MCEYVLHLYPVKNGHGSVRPHPIHHGAQFKQERYEHEHFKQSHVNVRVAFTQEITQNPGRISAPYLVSGQQQIETLDHVVNLRGKYGVEVATKSAVCCSSAAVNSTQILTVLLWRETV